MASNIDDGGTRKSPRKRLRARSKKETKKTSALVDGGEMLCAVTREIIYHWYVWLESMCSMDVNYLGPVHAVNEFLHLHIEILSDLVSWPKITTNKLILLLFIQRRYTILLGYGSKASPKILHVAPITWRVKNYVDFGLQFSGVPWKHKVNCNEQRMT